MGIKFHLGPITGSSSPYSAAAAGKALIVLQLDDPHSSP